MVYVFDAQKITSFGSDSPLMFQFFLFIDIIYFPLFKKSSFPSLSYDGVNQNTLDALLLDTFSPPS